MSVLTEASQAALPVKIGQASDEAVALFSSKSSEELLPRKTTDLGDDELSIETAFVTSWIFEMGCGVVIMISVLTVAWEVDGMQAPVFLQFMESLVTSFFLMEWLVRLKVMGWRWLLDPTVIFDTFIVWVPGVLAVWILQPLVQGDSTDFLKVVRTVRMLRLLRIVLFFKHFKAFQDLFQLVRGLLSSGGTLLSAMGLIAATLYMFAIFAIDLIGSQDFSGADEEILETQALFQGLFTTMITLIRFMHSDDSQGIMDALIKQQPWIWVFLWLFTALCAYVLLNLVTAVIVQQALEMAGADEAELAQELQEKRKRDLQELEDTFKKLDEDQSGQVSLEEFMQAFKIKEIRTKMTLLGLKEKEMVDLFRLLDTDGEGELSLEEFMQGMSQLQGQARNKDMVLLEKSIERLGKKLTQLAESDVPGEQRRQGFDEKTGSRLRRQLVQIKSDIDGRLLRAEKDVEEVAQLLYRLAQECAALMPSASSKVPEPPPRKELAPHSAAAGRLAVSRGSLFSGGPEPTGLPPGRAVASRGSLLSGGAVLGLAPSLSFGPASPEGVAGASASQKEVPVASFFSESKESENFEIEIH